MTSLRDIYIKETSMLPHIEDFTPRSGTIGDTIRIYGERFLVPSPIISVRIGNVPVTNLSIISDNEIIGTIGSGSITGRIILDTALGSSQSEIEFLISTSSSSWGNITGTLSDQTDLQNVLNSKESTISPGTISQYLRGDKTWQDLPTSFPPNGSAGGDLTGSYPNPSLNITGVVADIYGNSTTIPRINVDSKGRIMSVTNTAISFPVSSVNGLTGNIILDKSSIGLDNIDNTSDLNKPISNAVQIALNGKFNNPAGTVSQYIRGDGTLATLPESTPLNPAVLPHIATPVAPSAGNTSFYAKSDNKLYFRPAGGAETELITSTAVSTYGSCYIASPTVKEIPLFTATRTTTINELRGVDTASGTATLSIRINGVNVTGLTNLSVTTTPQNFTATGANTVSVGQRVTVNITAVSSAVDLEFTMGATLN